eukprot:scaffold3300_cov239-Pinguiococcus_pyrenoidosus.AAC.3
MHLATTQSKSGGRLRKAGRRGSSMSRMPGSTRETARDWRSFCGRKCRKSWVSSCLRWRSICERERAQTELGKA